MDAPDSPNATRITELISFKGWLKGQEPELRHYVNGELLRYVHDRKGHHHLADMIVQDTNENAAKIWLENKGDILLSLKWLIAITKLRIPDPIGFEAWLGDQDRDLRSSVNVLTQNGDLREDIVHETKLRALNSWKEWTDRPLTFKWLQKIAINMYRDYIRARRRNPPIISTNAPIQNPQGEFGELGDTIAEPDTVAATRDAKLQIDIARDILKADPEAWGLQNRDVERRILYYDRGETLQEIAAKEGVSVATVFNGIRRVNQALRQILIADDADADTSLREETAIAVTTTILALKREPPKGCSVHQVAMFAYFYSWQTTAQHQIPANRRSWLPRLYARCARTFGMARGDVMIGLRAVRSPFAYRCEHGYSAHIDDIEKLFDRLRRDPARVNWQMQLLLATRGHKIDPHDDFPGGHRFTASVL